MEFFINLDCLWIVLAYLILKILNFYSILISYLFHTFYLE
jgi:hypothetical protein